MLLVFVLGLPMWIVLGLKAQQSQGRGKKLENSLGCRTRCALKENKGIGKAGKTVNSICRGDLQSTN